MVQGAFGSNVGGTKRLLPFPTSKALAPVKFPHISAGPAAKQIHVSALHLTQAQTGVSNAKPSSSSGSISGYAKVAPAGAAGSSGGGGLLGDVEGFIGHLSSDVVNTVMGFPVGIMYMVNHPIAGAEGMVKATWADWSPLFHGNVDQWAHNFYQHPLAPILDVAGVLTLGAGTAARTAGALSKLGDVAEEGSMAAKLADFANPAIRSTELNRIAAGSRSGGLDAEKFRSLQEQSTAQYRIVKGPAGDVMHKAWSSNPLVRLREQQLAKIGNKVAENSSAMSKVVGDQAVYKRWSYLDKGRRAVAVQNQIQREIAAVAKGGKYSASLSVADKIRMIFPGIYDTASRNSRVIRVAAGSPAPDAKLLAEHGLAFLSDGKDFNRAEKVRNAFGSAKRRTLDDVTRVADAEETLGVKTHDQILMSAFKKAGQVITTTKPEFAAKVTHGAVDEYRVVSNTLAHRLSQEGAHADMVMRALWREPVKVWRHLLLGLSPRYFVNNFIGNTLMLMAAIDPVSLYHAYRSYVKVAHGAADVAEMDRQSYRHQVAVAKAAPRGVGPWNTHAAGVRKATQNADRQIAEHDVRLAAQGGNTSLTGREVKGGGLHPANQHLSGAYQGMSRDVIAGFESNKGLTSKLTNNRFNLYNVTHRYTDSLHRGMAMMYTAKRFPEFQAYKADALAKGMSENVAEYTALKETLRNGAARHTIVSQVEHMLGNYHTFTNLERGIKNNLVPFYAWDKALVAHVRFIVQSEPYKAAMGVAIGNQGSKVRDSMLGQVPDFMASMIPGALLGGFISNDKGRKGALNALSMSPYSTLGDLTNVAGALMGKGHLSVGETVGSTLNPMITGVAAELSGSDLQTGAPVKPDPNGPIVGLVKQVFGQLPQVKLFGDAIGTTDTSNTTKAGKPTLYEHGFTPDVTSFLGVPIRQISQQAAQAEVDKQKHKKKTHLPTSFPGL